MPFIKELPEWNAPGVTPTTDVKTNGWGPNQHPPADWFNWIQNKTYEALKELQQNAVHKDDQIAIADGSTTTKGILMLEDSTTSTSTTKAATPNSVKTVANEIATHKADETVHITATERTTWNGKASTSVATTTVNGLMSSADKTKLDGIAAGANNYTHPTTHPPSIITQDTSNRFVTDAEKSNWNGKASTSVATITANGLMSSTDKSKLDGIAAGAQVNTVTSVAGKTGAVTLAGTDIPVATTSVQGTMSSADKTKLDGIAAGANNYTHPTTHPPSIIAQDTSNRFVTDVEKSTWNNKLNLSGGTLTGPLSLNADPTNNLHAATKQYVDNVVSGLDVKKSVRVATTGNIAVTTETATVLTLTSAITAIDGITLAVNDRILVKNQTDPSQNGLYVYTNSTTLTRTTGTDSNSELTPGAFTFVEAGITNADTGWILSTDGAITLGTTAINWTQFSSAGIIVVDTTLTKTGNTIGLKSGIVTAGTYKSLTVDTYGRVTGGTNPTTLSGYGITDAAPSSHVGTGGTSHAAVTTSANGFMIAADKSKLDGIAAGANNYVHPTNHPPSIITQDSSNRFVTDVEKTEWNNKMDSMGAWINATLQNGFTNYDTTRIVQYRKNSNIVQVRGVAKNTAASNAAIFTLPSGYLPAWDLSKEVTAKFGSVECSISATGAISIAQWRSADPGFVYLYFDFPIN